ncbi:hypothetical protein ACUY3K_04270 [Corynebacterium uberis]|uniref:hypothetical protein n=1 Tax=Corynebacterium TaxID=1716 RepID=UPI001D0B2ED4|nr:MULTISPECIES: hypothetical protein [Corynebacterium]MCZ9308362.1 hypothetical protein [Corynebacterium sp. c6VSa_13]UDL74033.1 hypothetical protein LH391_02060 [Corynebacterium uberis]UDL75083.1 hypothetical protein LH393_07350 [Corynebacterium uberis]UDL77296.1 hypothetical protein LH394_07335 [Corynebacterium uberis]UDL79580.1 hypothetical protein LH392_07755 [Corynebacterium uberis]
MDTVATVAQDAASPNAWQVYVLFAVAGLLVGATWSAYQHGSKLLTMVAAVLATLALVAAIVWLIGGVT